MQCPIVIVAMETTSNKVVHTENPTYPTSECLRNDCIYKSKVTCTFCVSNIHTKSNEYELLCATCLTAYLGNIPLIILYLL